MKDVLPKVYFLVGVPGSGKSTFADFLHRWDEDIVIHSSDKLRAELFGDPMILGDNKMIFTELHKRILRDVRAGRDVVYDATNLNPWKRRYFMRLVRSYPCKVFCVVFDLPLEVCLARNASRNRVVPPEVIEEMFESFLLPTLEEGYDKIVNVPPEFMEDKFNKDEKEFI